MACTVCNDLGTYPIIDRFGSTLYEIKCPECLGISDEELERKAPEDRAVLANAGKGHG
jgi:phage FluMu protein Com